VVLVGVWVLVLVVAPLEQVQLYILVQALTPPLFVHKQTTTL
jgi:hypothetical protein